MEYNYEKLLDRVWNSLPEKLKSMSRYEIPVANTIVEGNQTIIRNFNEIADILNRDSRHILTYLSKELAAPATFDGNRAIIQRVLRGEMINKKIGDYAKEYVLCHECKRPDTKITELSGEKIIRCTACGGWWPMRKIK